MRSVIMQLQHAQAARAEADKNFIKAIVVRISAGQPGFPVISTVFKGSCFKPSFQSDFAHGVCIHRYSAF